MTLAQIASAAVRLVNKEHGIKLTKVAEFGDADLGAVVYRDKDFNEYRVMYFGDKDHLIKSDYHTDDKADALQSAQNYVTDCVIERTAPVDPTLGSTPVGMVHVSAKDGEQPTTVASEMPQPALKPRPRGYYSQPSPLLGKLFARFG